MEDLKDNNAGWEKHHSRAHIMWLLRRTGKVHGSLMVRKIRVVIGSGRVRWGISRKGVGDDLWEDSNGSVLYERRLQYMVYIPVKTYRMVNACCRIFNLRRKKKYNKHWLKIYELKINEVLRAEEY